MILRCRSVEFATTGYWETHTKKKDTGNVRVGNITPTGVKVGSSSRSKAVSASHSWKARPASASLTTRSGRSPMMISVSPSICPAIHRSPDIASGVLVLM